MNDYRHKIWIFGIIQFIGIIMTICYIWHICTLNPLDKYCHWYICNTEDFFEEFHKIKFTRIIVAISSLVIFSSGNIAAFYIGKLELYKDLWFPSKIVMRLLAAIIGIIVSTGLLWIIDYVYMNMRTIVN